MVWCWPTRIAKLLEVMGSKLPLLRILHGFSHLNSGNIKMLSEMQTIDICSGLILVHLRKPINLVYWSLDIESRGDEMISKIRSHSIGIVIFSRPHCEENAMLCQVERKSEVLLGAWCIGGTMFLLTLMKPTNHLDMESCNHSDGHLKYI